MKLETSKLIKDWQFSNISYNEVTLLVSKEFKSNVLKEVHPEKRFAKEVTSLILNWPKLILVKEEHPSNIELILLTFGVFKFDKSNFDNELQL